VGTGLEWGARDPDGLEQARDRQLQRAARECAKYSEHAQSGKHLCFSHNLNLFLSFLLLLFFHFIFRCTQAPLGFKCSTKRFKQDNGIPQSTAVPEYMTSSQLSLRKMAQYALMSEIQRDDMSSKQAERRMLAIRDDFTKFAERYGQSGLRVMPGGGSFGSAAVAIEAKHHKMTRRQLKIERKEIASQQINREDGATALDNIQTDTIGLSTQ
jgi:hypothetical protein